MFQIHTSDISDAWDSMLHGLKDPGLRLLKAFTRTIDVVLTLAVPVDKSSMSSTTSCRKDLYLHLFWKQVEETQLLFLNNLFFLNTAVSFCGYVR